MAEAAAAAKAAVPSAPPSRRKGKKRKGCSTAQQKEAATALDTSASIPPDIHKFDEQLEQVSQEKRSARTKGRHCNQRVSESLSMTLWPVSMRIL